MSQEKRYEFTVKITGCGDTEIEAWHDALEVFFSDPGPPTSSNCVSGANAADKNKDSLLRYIKAQCSEV